MKEKIFQFYTPYPLFSMLVNKPKSSTTNHNSEGASIIVPFVVEAVVFALQHFLQGALTHKSESKNLKLPLKLQLLVYLASKLYYGQVGLWKAACRDALSCRFDQVELRFLKFGILTKVIFSNRLLGSVTKNFLVIHATFLWCQHIQRQIDCKLLES